MQDKESGAEAHPTLGIRVFIPCVAVGGLVLLILTTQGSARVLSVATSIISMGAAILCGRALYRAAMRYERTTIADEGPSQGVEESPFYRIRLLSIVGAIGGPGIVAAVSPSLFMPIMAFLMLVPVVYIDAGSGIR